MTSENVVIGARLRAARKDARLTVIDLAERWRELAPEHVRRRFPRLRNLERTIRGHEAGEHKPGPRYRILWAHATGKSEAELFGEEPPHQQGPVAAPMGIVEHDTAPHLWSDMERRALLQLLTALGAEKAIPPDAIHTVLSGIEDALGNPLRLDEWEGTVHEYGQMAPIRTAGSLVNDLAADIVTVGRLLKRPDNAPHRAGLLRVSAGLSGLLAIGLGDLGNQHGARAAWNTAIHAADASGDRDLRVWVRGRAARDAWWSGRPTGVIVALTNDAADIANGTPSVGLAHVHAARASMAADQDDIGQAHASFDALKRTFDRLPQDSDEQSVFAYRATQLLWSESCVYARVGDGRAQKALTRAFGLYPSHARAARANLSLMESAVMVRAGEIDTGLEQAITTLESHPQAKGSARDHLAGRVLRILPDQARSHPAARELRALTAAT